MRFLGMGRPALRIDADVGTRELQRAADPAPPTRQRRGQTDTPRRTVGSFWQHAPIVFDYIRRAMPYAAPQSLSNDEYYAITAYVLFLNELIPEDAVMDRESLARVEMPNRDGFVLEARPDTADEACMANCRQGRPVRVTMDSRQFVKPGSESGTAKPQ